MAVSVRKRAIEELLPADCQASDAVKDVVRVSADAVLGVYQVTKIDITALPTEIVVGVIISKATATRCIVQVGGQVAGIYTGLTPGRTMFVGDDSKLTHTVPTHPATGVKSVYHAAMALAGDVLLLNIQTPSKLRA
jgi:hypothetical protein